MTPFPAGDQARELIDRVRASLPGGRVREVRMFGVIALMVDDAMAVAVHKDGSLLVRVDPAEDAVLLENPDASRAEMGAGRSMGEGWIRVQAKALHSDAALVCWLEAATRHLAQRKNSPKGTGNDRPQPRTRSTHPAPRRSARPITDGSA